MHENLPRGVCFEVEQHGSLEQVLLGPATTGDGRTNLVGALRSSMAMTGYQTLKEFQKAELVINARRSED
jgi:IMP dehydrogenase